MSPLPHVLVVATLAASSSAFDFGGGDDVEQKAGTVAPGVTTDSLTPTFDNNGVGDFGVPTQLTNPTHSGAGGQGWSSGEWTGTGNQGWPQQASWSSNPGGHKGQQGWPPNFGGDQGQMNWPSPPGGGDQGQKGRPSSPGGDLGHIGYPPNPVADSGQTGWPTNAGGDKGQPGWPANGGSAQGWGTLGVDCSGSTGDGRTPPGGEHDWGTLGVDCSGSTGSAGGWQQPGEGQGWTPPSGDQGWGTLGVDCSGSSEGGWAPPSGEEGSGALGADCSGSNAGGSTPETISPGSIAGGGSEETPAGSASIVPTPPSASSELESQGSLPSSGSGGDLGLSEATQTESSTPTESSVAADADQKFTLRSSTTATTSDDTTQQQYEGQEQQQQQGEKTAGGDVVQSMSVWGAPVVASTGTNLTSAKPSFGKITSKAGGCVVAKPTEYISEKYLDWVWQNRIGPNAKPKQNVNWNVMASRNFLMDKLVHNKGSINYCVRWDSSTNLEKSVASKFQGILERHYNKWNKWLEGYNCWPFKKLKVNMVGWATKDKAQFEWTDDSLGPVYEGSVDSEGVPQCPDECYRFYDNVNNRWSDTSSCTGEPFDVSFWLNDKIPYGFGYDWGQEVSLNDTMDNLYDENIMFIGHEIGHGFGLPDFYGLETKPSKDFPNSIMMAYSSTTITPSDGWMLRRVLDRVRSRYNF
ncbi:hypothetical protein PInf_024901 [Phytophthora infestans]|nr:hypothetical protein PInf_024901 [Phytophthora infestans]